jgi:hypothetical protein
MYQAGYVHLDIPDFDITYPFTLSAWIINGRQIGVNAALSLECVEVPYSLVQIGGWKQTYMWKALRRSPRVVTANTTEHKKSTADSGSQVVEKPMNMWIASKYSIKGNDWQHITYVETHDKLLLYVDGILVAHAESLIGSASFTQVHSFDHYFKLTFTNNI